MRFGESPISRVCTGWDTEIMGFSWNSRDEFARDRDFNNRTGRDRDSEILNGTSLDGIEFLDYNGTTGLSRIPSNPAGCSKRENPEESPAFRQGFHGVEPHRGVVLFFGNCTVRYGAVFAFSTSHSAVRFCSSTVRLSLHRNWKTGVP